MYLQNLAILIICLKSLKCFTSSRPTQYITGTRALLHVNWDIKDSSLVTTNNPITQLIERFGNLWQVFTKSLIPLSRNNPSGYPGTNQ